MEINEKQSDATMIEGVSEKEIFSSFETKTNATRRRKRRKVKKKETANVHLFFVVIGIDHWWKINVHSLNEDIYIR